MDKIRFEKLDNAELEENINREAQAEKLIHFLDKIDAVKFLSTEEDRKNFIRNLSFSEFESLLVRMNGIIRSLPIVKREVDGKDVILEGPFGDRYAPPEFEDKNDLLQEVLDKAKLTENPKDSALLISLAINSLHLFNDGNGRTSRLVYTLLHDGYSGSLEQKQKLKEVIGTEGRRKIDISPLILRENILGILNKEESLEYLGQPTLEGSEEIRNLDLDPTISEDLKEGFFRMIDDSSSDFGRIALYGFLLSHGKIYLQFFKEVPDESHWATDEKTGNIVSVPRTKIVMPLNEIVPTLTASDISEILNYYRDARKRYVEILFDVVSDPEKYKLTDESGWDDYTNLKEYFLFKVFMRNKKFFNNQNPVLKRNIPD